MSNTISYTTPTDNHIWDQTMFTMWNTVPPPIRNFRGYDGGNLTGSHVFEFKTALLSRDYKDLPSKIHIRFSELLGEPKNFWRSPETYLGPNYKTVINFWYYLDSLTTEQWEIVEMRYVKLGFSGFNASFMEKRPEIWYKTVSGAYSICPSYSGYAALAASAAYDYVWSAASDVTYELIGMNKLIEGGNFLNFVPLFELV